MGTHLQTMEDISLRYELSLSIGTSLDTYENCKTFLQALTIRKDLSFASIWLKSSNKNQSTTYHLLRSDLTFPAKETKINEDHFILKRLANIDCFSIASDEVDFEKMIQEETVTQGAYAIYKLGDLGFIKLFSATRACAFCNDELEQLSTVFKKFKISLEGCLAHERLLVESESRKKIQQAFSKLNQDLTLAKLTAEQAQLTEQQFLANMSHEIRTPMNAVIGMIHLLYETKLSSKQKEYLDVLQFSADGMMSILNNLLDLSKIEAGKLALEERQFNLNQLLQSLHRTFQFKVRDKSVSVNLDVDPKIENLLLGDNTRLLQILINLLGNASKFTHRGTIGLRVKLLQNIDKQCLIEFSVYDTGIGIPADKLKLIFENFKQADVETSRKYGGTGLGLTIVKQLVELQNGTISVKSQPGEGSVFRVSLPFVDTGIKAVEQVSKLENKHVYLRQLVKKLRLLVVEDNEMNQKLVAQILQIWGCDFAMANNGQEAIQLTKKEQYDVILMDIHMPGMEGVEATKIIRNMPNNYNNQTPIIALTAAALLDEKNRALEVGMNDYLTKPFSPTLLLEKIGKVLGLSVEEVSKKEKLPIKKENKKALTINLNYLYEFSNGDRIFVKDMVATFIRETPISFKEIKNAYHHKNWENVYKIAHRLKPSFMMLGMKSEQNIAANIEKLIKTENYSSKTIFELIQQLESAAQQAYPILLEKLRQV